MKKTPKTQTGFYPQINRSMPTRQEPSTREHGVDLNSKLNVISKEIDELDAKNLLSRIDPSIQSLDIVEQIQAYCEAIKNEIYVLRHNLRRTKSNEKKIVIKQKEIQMLKIPKLPNYIYEFHHQESRRTSVSVVPTKAKTKVNSKILIRSLENDIVLINQKVNDYKCKNNKLSLELEEYRKNLAVNETKLYDLKSQFVECESEFFKFKDHLFKDMPKHHQKSNFYIFL